MTRAIAPPTWPIALIASQFTASSHAKAVVAVAGHEDHQQYVPRFSRGRQGTSVPSSTGVMRWQLLKVCASLGRFNHTVPCAVKHAGIVDDIGLDRDEHPATIGSDGAILSAGKDCYERSLRSVLRVG